MKAILIASIAHAINSAYCLAIGDQVAPPFAECPEEMQQGTLAGVQLHIDNPDTTPEQSHESWLADKTAKGWVYGEVKDMDAKTHPCCRPYAELPESQQVKDYLFRAAVHALKDVPDATEDDAGDERVTDLSAQLGSATEQLNAALAENIELKQRVSVPQMAAPGAAVVFAAPAGYLPVKYIGPRDEWTDRQYGSGLYFITDQIRYVPPAISRRFLKHGDLFKVPSEDELAALHATVAPAATDDTITLMENAQREQKEAERKELDLSNLHREVDNMQFTELAEFAKSRYGLALLKQHGLEKGRAAVHARIDQLGAV